MALPERSRETPCRFTNAKTIDDGFAIELTRRGGGTCRFHAIWLRDNAPDPQTRSPENGQKLITLADIPADVRVRSVEIEASGSISVVFEPEGKAARFDDVWLQQHAYDRPQPKGKGWLPGTTQTWDKTTLREVPSAEFNMIRADRGALHRWLKDIAQLGFAKLTGCPIRSGALLEVVALFGYVRETNYGKWFDVKADVSPTNLANTGLQLQAHTDNPYRDPAPTMQILYCLENSAAGGDSIVIDGFRAAQRLRDEQRHAFKMLSEYLARFEFAGTSNVALRSRRPMIELAADGELTAVRFNNRSCAPITDVPYEHLSAYYDAYRELARIIDDPSMAVTFKLAPGECFLVDNTRVLHARTGFSGAGSRWLQGCYPDKDGLLSTLSVLDREDSTV